MLNTQLTNVFFQLSCQTDDAEQGMPGRMVDNISTDVLVQMSVLKAWYYTVYVLRVVLNFSTSDTVVISANEALKEVTYQFIASRGVEK